MWRSVWVLVSIGIVQGWTQDRPFRTAGRATSPSSSAQRHAATADETVSPTTPETDEDAMFESFIDFLIQKQSEIIAELEDYEEGSATFTRDAWGIFDEEGTKTGKSGGLTRVLQGGNIIEKGACSLTVIRQGVLSADRAATIRARQDISINEGDKYAAAALSMVLHSRSPHVPTFRSDVRVFCVTTAGDENSNPQTLAWFGGGAGKYVYDRYEMAVENKTQTHRFLFRFDTLLALR